MPEKYYATKNMIPTFRNVVKDKINEKVILYIATCHISLYTRRTPSHQQVSFETCDHLGVLSKSNCESSVLCCVFMLCGNELSSRMTNIPGNHFYHNIFSELKFSNLDQN